MYTHTHADVADPCVYTHAHADVADPRVYIYSCADVEGDFFERLICVLFFIAFLLLS